MKATGGDALGWNLLWTPRFWRAAASEFISVLLFVFLGGGSVVAEQDGGYARLLDVALTHGLVIAALIAASASCSGGHLNPSVTLAFLVTGQMKLLGALVYMLAQVFGGMTGAGLAYGCLPGTNELGADAYFRVSAFQAFMLELITTYGLVHVVLNTTLKNGGSDKLAPLFIGLAVFGGIMIAGNYTGGSMNPARSLGAAVVSGEFRHHWVYWFGPGCGATLAAVVHKYLYLRPSENELTPAEQSALREFGYEAPDTELFNLRDDEEQG